MRSALRMNELHWPFIGTLAAVSLLGVYNLRSSAAVHNPNLYLTQLLILGIAAALVASIMLFDYRYTESLAYPFYGIVCLLLVAVLLQGKSAGGAQRWLTIGPVTFQPSELAKIATIVCLARYFSTRVPPDGYSLRTLSRPLNFSRPLGLLMVVLLFWGKPWMADPIGEVSRFVYGQIGIVPPPIGDGVWFRTLLVMALLAATAALAWMVVSLERSHALLSPWPPGRRNRLLALVGLAALSSGVALTWVWDAALLRDPFGVAITALAQAGAPNGSYAELQSGYGLRVLLLLLCIAYLAGAWWNFRVSSATLTDKVIAPVDLLALPAVLVLVEPDLGTAGIIVLIGFSMILIVGVRLRTILILALVGTLFSGVAWFGILKDYQKSRILTFIDPEGDAQGAGWNAVQSMIAVGSGRWVGKGHGEGTQTRLKFLPEQHTDFAFGVWAEEQGFLGCLFLLSIYLALLWMALSIAGDARDVYGSLLATGVAALFLWQALINVSMVIGMFPVVGMTLPLFSYGGTSFLTAMFGAGLLLNVHWRRRAH